MKRVYWLEPWYGPEELPVNVELSCSVEHAINLAKNNAKRLGREYSNDEEALDDFIVVHWAVVKDEGVSENVRVKGSDSDHTKS